MPTVQGRVLQEQKLISAAVLSMEYFTGVFIGLFFSNGTRFTDATCLQCPGLLPENAKVARNGTGCQWECNAGFNNTVFQ
jgi:hypothetical protein